MRIIVTLWLTLLALFGRELVSPPIREAKPKRKHYPARNEFL
jgi:hypothetical protein